MAAGVTLAAVLRKGGFFWPDHVVLPVLLVGMAAAGVRRLRPAERLVVLALGLFVGWWMVAGAGWGVPGRALRLAGSASAFGAALLLGTRLDVQQRSRLEQGVVALGVGTSLAGLLGLVAHVYPLAMVHQDTWRLAATLTYANATAVLLALILPVAMATATISERWRRAAVFVILTGLLATLSRGGILAGLIPPLLLGRRRLAGAAWPAVLAAGTSLILVATVSSEEGGRCAQGLLRWSCRGLDVGQLLAVMGLMAGLGLALRGPGLLHARPRHVVIAVTVLVMAMAGSAGLRSSLAARSGLDSVDARVQEWSAAWSDVRTSPVVGVGPERDLGINHGRDLTYYAHNEYLQVAAGAGLVGLALLGLVAASLRRALRSSTGPPSKVGLASLLALAIGGLFDFVWHLPAIAMVGGWITAASLGRQHH